MARSSASSETNHRLAPRWAHLLCGDLSPLRLAPGILCTEDAVTEQVVLYSCRTLAIEGRGKVKLLSFRGGSELNAELPA